MWWVVVFACCVVLSHAAPLIAPMRGVAYSPVPIGANPLSAPPFGDYFTPEFRSIWSEDLRLISELGANTIRIYGWNNERDHTEFLDECSKRGVSIVIGYYLGTVATTPVASGSDREAVVSRFQSAVARYAQHPAVWGYSFGNELNGIWNGFLSQLNAAANCGWNAEWCYGGTQQNDGCIQSTECVYRELFSFIESAASAARRVAPNQFVTTSFADVDLLPIRIGTYEHYAPSVSVWGAQIYRGSTFGGFFEQFERESKRLLLVTEYGVDSYRDVDRSGWAVPFDASLASAGEQTQAEWDIGLTREIARHLPSNGGSVLGGCVMEWSDEYWKNADTNVKRCPNGPGNGECEFGAHAGCPRAANDLAHAICGYPLPSAPDGYSNEAWFGLIDYTSDGGRRPRPVYRALQQLWTRATGTVFDASTKPTDLRSKHSDAGTSSDETRSNRSPPTHWSIYAWFILFVGVVVKLTVDVPFEQWQLRMNRATNTASANSQTLSFSAGNDAPVTIKDRYVPVAVADTAGSGSGPGSDRAAIHTLPDERTYLLTGASKG